MDPGVLLLKAYEKHLQRPWTKLYQALHIGQRSRATASTNMNLEPSRSHSIFVVTIKQKDTSSGTEVGRTEDYWMKENRDIFVPSEDQNAIACKLTSWFQHEFVPANSQMCYPDAKTTGYQSHVCSFSNATRYRSRSRFVDN
jgi:hypothetical protein